MLTTITETRQRPIDQRVVKIRTIRFNPFVEITCSFILYGTVVILRWSVPKTSPCLKGFYARNNRRIRGRRKNYSVTLCTRDQLVPHVEALKIFCARHLDLLEYTYKYIYLLYFNCKTTIQTHRVDRRRIRKTRKVKHTPYETQRLRGAAVKNRPCRYLLHTFRGSAVYDITSQ